MAGYASSSTIVSTPRTTAKSMPAGRIRHSERNNVDSEMKSDGVVLRGDGECRTHHVMIKSVPPFQSRPQKHPSGESRYNSAQRVDQSSDPQPRQSLPGKMPSWDLPPLAQKTFQHELYPLHNPAASQQTHEARQVAMRLDARAQDSSTSPSSLRPPPTPRPERLPTPDLDDPPEGMFCDCFEQDFASKSRYCCGHS
ncbi:hypothetical protein NA57DRAFT_58608 [Rhizodiscina lignyota]|uniref:Uncharacterized protein n=1 Tax=Rhizodiscina lignyota TaxID=1504668 RepID=A0A9P4I7N1_9PEZI|nr:hypothetical protein NA57DRAFT_58608 [Rhizodiscina lignyota]